MPAAGGTPKRLTHHPVPDRMLDWYPDGKASCSPRHGERSQDGSTSSTSFRSTAGCRRSCRCRTASSARSPPTGRPSRSCRTARTSAPGSGTAAGGRPDIWLFDLATHASKNRSATTPPTTAQPMWHGATLYFLSDRDANKRNNIWALDTATGKMRQVTTFAEYDVHFPSIGPSDIVFENGGRLYLLDLADREGARGQDRGRDRPRHAASRRWRRSPS